MSDLNDTLIAANEEKGKHQLMDLINELQDAVTEMKQAFLVALDQLKVVSSEDQSLRRTVEGNKAEAQEQAAQVLRLVLSFKSEFAWVRSAMESAQEQSANLARVVQRMEGDRGALLDELVACGALSQHARERLSSSSGGIRYHCDVRPEHSSSSGAPSSSDSGVAHLLERAHAAFSMAPHPTPMYTSTEVPRQKGPATPTLDGEHPLSWPMEVSGSGGDGNVGQVSTMVRDYVAGLVSGKGEWEERRVADYAADNGSASSPDSDSSLSRAITKSLGLSTSLGRQCGLELDQMGGAPSSAEQQERSPRGAGAAKVRSSLRSSHTSSDSDTESSRVLVTLPKYSIGSGKDGCSYRGVVGAAGDKIDASANGRKGKDEALRSHTASDEGDLEKKRRLLIQELIDAERCYCSTLRTLKQAFAEPLSAKDILSPKDVDTLFPREVEALHQQHTSLLTMLEESMRQVGSSDQKPLGDILRHFIEPEGLDALRLYTSYVDNFPDALQTFHKLCRCSPEFTTFLKDCLESPDCGGLDLGGFLLTPVQRLPRLVLVLRRLLALTPKHHHDWAPISFAISRLATFLSRLNDSMEHSFQLVAAQIGAPSEREEADFGHMDNFDESVCGESTANDEGHDGLLDLTSEGENGLEMKSVGNLAQSTPPSNKDSDTCSTGIRRRVGQIVASSEREKVRPVSGSSCAGEASVQSRTSSPPTASIHMSPDQDTVADEARQPHASCHWEDTPSKKVGCPCIRRGRDLRGMKKYSRICSIKSREGSSSPDLSNAESKGSTSLGSASVWAATRKDQSSMEQRRRPSRSERVEDSTRCIRRLHHAKQCCVHDCSSGCAVLQRRRGTSLPRRACGTEVRRRTHSTGRTSGERETSSDDDSESQNVCYVSPAHQCKAQEVRSPAKEKTKRKWFKTSKSMHDVPNHGSDVYAEGSEDPVKREGDSSRRRHHSGDVSLITKLAVARSAGDLSLNGSLSGNEGACDRGVSAEGRDAKGKKETETHRQLLYTARMLRCSSLEVATVEKLCEGKETDKGAPDSGGASREDGEIRKKGKNKKLSLRASIKNMLSFKRRYVRDENSRDALSEKVKEIKGPVPTIAFGCPYKMDENLHSLITKLNRMPTYIQLVIFCLKETSV